MENSAGIIVFSVIAFIILSAFLYRFLSSRSSGKLLNKPAYILVAFLIILLGLAFLPLDAKSKASFFNFLGLVITAIIAISSTTFVSNAMAGIMLRSIKNFRPGDFIEVKDQHGRVSEMSLLHTEIQTKDSSLSTLPNMFLISNPVTVTPAKDALVAARLSLGYDISHSKVEALLIQAAHETGLKDAFVQITDLNDFSISYRAAGFAPDAKHLLTCRSNLRKQIVSTLHQAGIEIVSPTFMNQRQFKPDEQFISIEKHAAAKAYQKEAQEKHAEDRVFEKAESARTISEVEQLLDKTNAQIAALKKEKPDHYEAQIESLKRKASALEKEITSLKKTEEQAQEQEK